jgi:deoxyribodipyrimidine photolyase
MTMSPLPAHLAERVSPLGSLKPRDGDFVIYWMRVAQRAFENPALDAALLMAAHLKLPVFVYQGLSERYPYASDRHHTFVLEGARDVQRAFKERGIGYALHVERPGHRGPHLKALAARAALVLTEDVPVAPFTQWDAQLARVAPLWRVDASCVAPFRALGRGYQRAFTFRRDAQALWRARRDVPWPAVEAKVRDFLPQLPFPPIDLAAESLPELVAQCEVDHAVGPVHHTPGGSAAGNLRWAAFLTQRLDSYAKDRLDPNLPGISRMSAYLHCGQVSPFQLAREAGARRTDGAEAYLDELLTWRELAWNFCAFSSNHSEPAALPAWAQKTLREHERDARPALHSYDTLARAKTNEPLWDAAQRQLLTHGELHRSVRMSWGKALLQWTRTAKEALATLLDLSPDGGLLVAAQGRGPQIPQPHP